MCGSLWTGAVPLTACHEGRCSGEDGRKLAGSDQTDGLVGPPPSKPLAMHPCDAFSHSRGVGSVVGAIASERACRAATAATAIRSPQRSPPGRAQAIGIPTVLLSSV